jgi:NAD(P)H dehydrogenase (quinone)
MILVTGSTGQLGRLVIEHLLTLVPADQVIAGARDLEKAKEVLGPDVNVRQLDYDLPETVTAAMEGVTKVLLISGNDIANRIPHHERVIKAAADAGVELLAYTSILFADTSPMILARDHSTTEGLIRDSALPFVFLRNGWYAENYLMDLEGTIERGVIIGAAGDGRVSPATRDDLALAAAKVLSSDGHANKIYELAGDEALTLPEIAGAFAQVSGKPVVYQDMPAEQYAGVLESVGVPAAFAAVLADSDTGLSKGWLENDGTDLSDLIGRPTTLFKTVLEDVL